jgi:hypothetical protein
VGNFSSGGTRQGRAGRGGVGGQAPNGSSLHGTHQVPARAVVAVPTAGPRTAGRRQARFPWIYATARGAVGGLSGGGNDGGGNGAGVP